MARYPIHLAIVPAGAAPGNEGPLVLVDWQDGPQGRSVCTIQGALIHDHRDRGPIRLLDEQDIDNARLFQAAARLRAALADLIEWNARTGEWDAPCWDEAQAVLDALREPSP